MTFLVYTPDAVYDDGGVLEREIGGDLIDLRVEKWRSQAELNEELLRKADGLLVWQMVTLDAPTIARLQRCKIIVRCGTGYNNIDVLAAVLPTEPPAPRQLGPLPWDLEFQESCRYGVISCQRQHESHLTHKNSRASVVPWPQEHT